MTLTGITEEERSTNITFLASVIASSICVLALLVVCFYRKRHAAKGNIKAMSKTIEAMQVSGDDSNKDKSEDSTAAEPLSTEHVEQSVTEDDPTPDRSCSVPPLAVMCSESQNIDTGNTIALSPEQIGSKKAGLEHTTRAALLGSVKDSLISPQSKSAIVASKGTDSFETRNALRAILGDLEGGLPSFATSMASGVDEASEPVSGAVGSSTMSAIESIMGLVPYRSYLSGPLDVDAYITNDPISEGGLINQ